MRLPAILLALAPIVALADPDPACLKRQQREPTLVCADGIVIEAITLICVPDRPISRSPFVTTDVNSTGDHLLEALNRK